MPNATTPPKKWYVFDAHDCFEHHDEVQKAATVAANLVAEHFVGVHIVHMTQVQFNAYCHHGDLVAALKL